MTELQLVTSLYTCIYLIANCVVKPREDRPPKATSEGYMLSCGQNWQHQEAALR